LIVTLIVFGSLMIANHLRPETVGQEELATWGYVANYEVLPLTAFSLKNHDDVPVDQQIFHGDWTLVFFGFTYCPDICPTTLSVLNSVVETMDHAPRVVMVSVDPDRDTTELLRRYVTAFNPSFVGVSGDHAEVRNLASQLHVVYDTTEDTVNHTTNVALLNPLGEYVGHFRVPHRPQMMVRALAALM
jgi:protein SCO1